MRWGSRFGAVPDFKDDLIFEVIQIMKVVNHDAVNIDGGPGASQK